MVNYSSLQSIYNQDLTMTLKTLAQRLTRSFSIIVSILSVVILTWGFTVSHIKLQFFSFFFYCPMVSEYSNAKAAF